MRAWSLLSFPASLPAQTFVLTSSNPLAFPRPVELVSTVVSPSPVTLSNIKSTSPRSTATPGLGAVFGIGVAVGVGVALGVGVLVGVSVAVLVGVSLPMS